MLHKLHCVQTLADRLWACSVNKMSQDKQPQELQSFDDEEEDRQQELEDGVEKGGDVSNRQSEYTTTAITAQHQQVQNVQIQPQLNAGIGPVKNVIPGPEQQVLTTMSSNMKIQCFNGTFFTQWKQAILLELESCRLKGIVLGTERMPTFDQDRQKEWKAADLMA